MKEEKERFKRILQGGYSTESKKKDTTVWTNDVYGLNFFAVSERLFTRCCCSCCCCGSPYSLLSILVFTGEGWYDVC